MKERSKRMPWGATLEESHRAAREHHGFEVALEAFCARAATLPEDYQTHIDPLELYLLCGCQANQDAALTAFYDQMLARARSALARMKLPGELAAEAEQKLWEKFVVAKAPDTDMPLWKYVGRGKLSAFLQVSATREAISLLRREGKYVQTGERDLAETLGASPDLDLSLLRATHAPAFKSALERAFGTLTPRQRTLLRLHHLEKVTGEQLARMYKVHRATITRWLADARANLVTETRKDVMQNLKVSASEFKSLMGAFMSRLDVSINRVLRE